MAAGRAQSASITVDNTHAVRSVDARIIGVNSVIWVPMAADNQTIALAKAAGLGVIRIPGGSASDSFDWSSNRSYSFTNSTNPLVGRTINPWSWSTGLAQFMTLIDSLNSATFVTVNYGSGSPQQAAAWVAYSNSSSTLLGTAKDVTLGTDSYGTDWKTAGYWSGLRAAAPLATDDGRNFLRMGRAAPFALKYWEIGNENYGTWEQDTHALPNDGYTYATAVAAPVSTANNTGFWALMKAVDPLIKIGVVIPAGEDAYANGNGTSHAHAAINPRTGATHYGWGPVILSRLKTLGVTPDFLTYHRYEQNPGSESDSALLAAPENGIPGITGSWAADAVSLRQELSDYIGSSAASTELLIGENNSVNSNPGKQANSLVNGLYYADSFGNILQTEFNSFAWWAFRNGPPTNTAGTALSGNMSSSLYGWRINGDYGILSSPTSLSTPAETTYYDPFPVYYMMKLMTHFAPAGGTVIKATSSNALLTAYAVRNAADETLRLLVINKSPSSTFTASISLTGFVAQAAISTYSYGIPQDNSAQTGNGSPDIATSSLTNGSTSFAASFAPYSATVLALHLGAAPVFTTQPTGRTVIFGGNTNFTAAATGIPTPAYQWQVSANAGSTWINLSNTAPYSGTTTGTLTITGATMPLNGHQFRCVASNGVNPNATSSAATLTVVKAVPVITWGTPTAISFGTPLSATQLNATASVPGILVYSPAAGTVPGAGTQTLNVSFTPNDATDYTTAVATRKLTVNKAVPAIAWPASPTIPAGTTLSSTQLNARASVPGAFVYAPAAGTVLSANTYSLKVTFTPTDLTNYVATTATKTLVVSSRPIPVITWPAPAAITYGKALSAAQLNATASVPGAFVYTPATGTVVNAGSQVLNVKFTPTDTTTYAATAGTQTLNVAKAAQAINFPAPGNKTYGSAPFNLWAAATSGQAVTFSVVGGPAKIYWNTVVLTGAGTVTLRASQAGSANYNPATPVDHSFTVAKAPQTITFPAPGNKVYGAAPFNLSGSATSGLGLTFSVVSGPATIAGRTVTLTGPGTVTIQASQAGNANYNAATPVNRSFTVAKASNNTAAKTDSKVADTSNDDFLRKLFVNVLGRQITADELGSTGAAMSAGKPRAEVLGDLLGSAEYSRRQIDPAIKLYCAALGRVPDYTDVQTCSSALAGGKLTLAEAADQVAGSADFAQRYGSLDNTQYVRQLYRNVLGRDADAASLAAWVGRLDAGASRGAALAALSQSAEFKADAADPVEILRLYFVLFHRIPTAAELQGWEDFLQGGDQADIAAPAQPDIEDWLNDSATPDEQMRDDLLADPAFTNG